MAEMKYEIVREWVQCCHCFNCHRLTDRKYSKDSKLLVCPECETGHFYQLYIARELESNAK